jgi:hypothetical protein
MSCLICKKRRADKTGSHIIPHFLVESMVNEGEKGRDKEQSFSLNSTGSGFFFGRSVLPEKLEKSLEREISDKDSNTHHYLMDNVFCSICEEQLSFLESIFSEKVKPDIENVIALTEDQMKIGYFFWLTVILRCSITEFSNFKLPKGLEEEQRLIVLGILDDSRQNVETNCVEGTLNRPLITLAHTKATDKSRNFILLHPEKSSPFLLIINEYTLIFDSSDECEIRNLEGELDIEIASKIGNTFSLSYLSNSERENIIKYCADIVAKQLLENAIRSIVVAYSQITGGSPNQMFIEGFEDELINDEDIPLPDRYRPDRIIKIMSNYLLRELSKIM